MPVLIETDGLAKTFGDIRAVDGITLNVRKGEVLGFLGPNGAGKSTTMKMITGFLEPTAGSARVHGLDIVKEGRLAKELLGYLPEGAPCYGDMTTQAFLRFIAEIRGFSGALRDKRVDGAVDKTGLQSVLSQTIETLSKGYKRRVGLAQAILHDPPILILDEPTDGLDPNQKHHVRGLIKDMSGEKAIIVSTHILEEVEAVCSRAVVIDKGKIVADGTAEELQRRMPYHNAVSIHTKASAADAVRSALMQLDEVSDVERLGEANGRVQLRALAKSGEPIVAEVAGAVKANGLEIEEMYVERGRLDDVFRQITTSDTSAADA
jgi:ABC-2 type transport system ATP-binding protein